MAEVAVLGTGRMGAAMAQRFAEAGHGTRVWNRTSATAEELAGLFGIRAFHTAAEAVAGADVVISMLANGSATKDVLVDEDLSVALAHDVVVCDMATSGVDAARTLSRHFQALGVMFVDAPVSGSVTTVNAGQLLVMASGDSAAVDRVSHIMTGVIAKKVAHVGEAGAGQAMKLAVNLLVHATNAAASEALALASAAGVAPEDAYDVILDSVVSSPFLAYKRAAFLDPEQPVAMSLALTHKDLGLVQQLAADRGLSLPTTTAVEALVAAACESDLADGDMTELFGFVSSQRGSDSD